MKEATKTTIIVGVATAIICVLLAVLIGQGSRNSVAIVANTTLITDLTSYVDKSLHKKELRIIRIEDILKNKFPSIGLERPFEEGSYLQLTDFGKNLLLKSGMTAEIEKHKKELIAQAKTMTMDTPFQVEKVAKFIIDDFDWENGAGKIDDYIFENAEAKMFDFWEIAAIQFRDILMEELGMEYPTKPQEKPRTEEKRPNPSN